MVHPHARIAGTGDAQQCLRRQIADTLQSPTERQIDEELASLGAALSHE